MNRLKERYQSFLVSGTQHDTDLDDSRRIRLVNFAGFWTLLLVPFMGVFQWRLGNTHELPILVYLILSTLIVLVFNKKGYNQVAAAILIISYILAPILIIAVAQNQTAAPYFSLFTGLLAIYLLKNSVVRHTFTILGFAVFFGLNGYQLLYRPFSLEEYGPILLFLVAVYLAVTKYDRDYRRNEKTIKEQSDDLIQLQDEKHLREMELKQKDIETVLAGASMQKKIKENLHEELKQALKADNLDKEIARIARELGAQNDRLDQMHIVQENMEELNAQFYERLIETHSGLSKTELEHCALVRLGLSSKEIATLRNSTENSVNVVKSRIRKRMSLTNQNLYQYLTQF